MDELTEQTQVWMRAAEYCEYWGRYAMQQPAFSDEWRIASNMSDYWWMIQNKAYASMEQLREQAA
jgi:hypothetical protein